MKILFLLMVSLTRSLSRSRLNVKKVFERKNRRKAQFFILAAFTIVTMFYLISRWIEPFTIIDTSQVPLMDEIFIFNNIKEKTFSVIRQSKSCEDVTFNIQEYREFVVNYALGKGYRLTYNYTLDSCPSSSFIVKINMILQSPRTTLSSNFSYPWP